MKPAKTTPTPFHPFLLASASVVSLYAANKSEIGPLEALRLLLVMLLLTFVLWILCRLILRNKHKAAALTSLLVLLFTTYGQVFTLMQKTKALKTLTHHRYLIILYAFLLALGLFLIIRSKRPERMTLPLNLILAITLVIPIIQTASFFISKAGSGTSQNDQGVTNPAEIALSGSTKPDIYYIILDSYGRQDALLDFYDLDNSEFIAALRERGFFVGDCSRSNYGHTRLSLSSSLNMNYLEALNIDFDPDTRTLMELDPLIQDNEVRRLLREQGYQTVAFETGYHFTELSDADYYYENQANLLFSPYLEPFEYVYLENTLFRVIIDTEYAPIYRYVAKITFPFTNYKNRIQNVFKTLPEIPEIEGPKFVFVHLPIPHHPFIFLPDGSINPDKSYYPDALNMPLDMNLMAEGYANQVKYVNAQILPIIDELLAKSDQPPVIILQGDHGVQAGDRLNILNAIYLPDGGEDLSPSISPVNTFRVVFNRYFNANLPYLEDSSFMSTSDDKLDWVLKEENYESCIAK